MNRSSVVHLEQSPRDHLAEEQVLPCLPHRFALSCGELNVHGSSMLVNDQTETCLGILKLLKRLFMRGPESLLDNEMTYYNLHAVRKELADIDVIICVCQENWEMENQKHSPKGTVVFDVLQQALLRAEGVMALLLDQFTEDGDSSQPKEKICGAIDAVMNEVTEIKDAMNDFHQANKKRRT